ncbi:MAG TPA: site-2 protease family protein [Gemmataceae bacterium]|nr:site-2 protease family protein [Gemmataceae bacterium]
MDNSEGSKPESIKPEANANSDALRAGEPPYAPPPEVEIPEPEPGLFTPTNIGILGVLLALVVVLLMKFSLEEIWYVIKAGLGLSFVIFVHELGHFLAAKWCDVNVTTFSIGFGPAIPGCRYKWGETTYKLAILPLGGYVQMVGQVDGDESSDGSEDDPRSYRNKTVAQRMLIISAGVIMNAIFAALCFIAVYQGSGKEYPAPIIGTVDSRSEAFAKGLRTDALISEFDGDALPTFSALQQSVINSMENQKLSITYQLPGREPISTEIVALDSDNSDGKARRPVIGITSDSKPQFALRGNAKMGPYYKGTPAAEAKFESSVPEAEAKFHYRDVIVAMSDPDTDKVTDLPDDPNFPGHGQRSIHEFMRRVDLLAGKDIVLRVQRGADDKVKTYDVTVAPFYRLDLGVRMHMGRVTAIREGSTSDGKILPERPNPDNASQKLEADKIIAVKVTDADGKKLVYSEADKTLDPERLPFQLRQWSDRLDKAKFKGDRWVEVVVQRHQKGAPNQFADEPVKLKWDTEWRFDRVAPISRNSPMPIPELGLGYQVMAVVANKTRNDSAFEVNDVITNIRMLTEDSKEDTNPTWIEPLQENQWAFVSYWLGSAVKLKKLEVKVKRGGEEKEIEVPIVSDKTWPLPERGWVLASDTRRIKATDPANAVWLGLKDTHARMMEVFLNIRGMVTGRISFKNFGGPITIARGAYFFASLDFSEFLFFLGLISINLAVVNFLPIPILDGGHMVFLIYEKIRGKPASEGVRIVATWIGLGLVLSLMIFVLYLDVTRWLL